MNILIPMRKLRMVKSVIVIGVSFLILGYISRYYLLSLENTLMSGKVVPSQPVIISTKDDLNYGVVVDCGSSGSRLYVYYWKQHSGVLGELLNITALRDSDDKAVIFKKEPGLSSFGDNPSASSDYLAPLLQYAVDHIPSHKIKQTPLYIMATAGLRLLNEKKQQGILSNIRSNISSRFDFLFSDSHVEVISGKWEGLYAWIAVNLALGMFNHKLDDKVLTAVDMGGKVHVRKRTVGSMDLGGASLQTTFELPPTMAYVDTQIRDSVIELELGCTSKDSSHRYRLYTQTFLGFGGNEANKKQRNRLLHEFLNQSKTITTATGAYSFTYTHKSLDNSSSTDSISFQSPPPLKPSVIPLPTKTPQTTSSSLTPLDNGVNDKINKKFNKIDNNNNNNNKNLNITLNNTTNFSVVDSNTMNNDVNDIVNKKVVRLNKATMNHLNNENVNNRNNVLDSVFDNSLHNKAKRNILNSLGNNIKINKNNLNSNKIYKNRLKRLKRSINVNKHKDIKADNNNAVIIEDPCSPPGYRESFVEEINKPNINSNIKNTNGNNSINSDTLAYTLHGMGNMEKCLSLARRLLNKSKCPLTNQRRCTMDGVIIPDVNYRSIEFYGFSEFYYTMEDILGISGQYNYQLFYNKAKTYCETPWYQIEEWKKMNKFPRADSQRYETQCFKSAWMMTVLHDGLNLPKYFKHFKSILSLNNAELHWSLGALLHKTKLFPLRDMERATESRRVSHRGAHSSEFIITVFLVCLLISVLLYLCLKSFNISKFFSRKGRVTLQINDDHLPHVVIVGESKSDHQKMIRSRSFGAFVNPGYAEI